MEIIRDKCVIPHKNHIDPSLCCAWPALYIGGFPGKRHESWTNFLLITGQSRLTHHEETAACCEFLSPLRRYRLRSGLNPRTLGPVGNTLAITPPSTTTKHTSYHYLVLELGIFEQRTCNSASGASCCSVLLSCHTIEGNVFEISAESGDIWFAYPQIHFRNVPGLTFE
jgi:hypothetical protein